MIKDWGRLSLWPNQKAALRACKQYLSSPKRGFLVQMPTGAGKTVVIAVLSTAFESFSRVLLTSPSAALCDQLRIDLSEIWEKLCAHGSSKLRERWCPGPDTIFTLLPTNDAQLQAALKKNQRTILVGTLQALAQIKSERPHLYRHLKSLIDLVLVDEGHREPAPMWAEAARGLDKPTILFSATPYRNDLRYFDIDSENVSFLSFREAVDGFLIRDVSFEPLQKVNTEADFARQVIARRTSLIKSQQLPSNIKVIVRCGSEDSVWRMHRAFVDLLTSQRSVLGIHEGFSREKNLSLKALVPKKLRKRQETYLIHQFKLVEGIDDPAATILAIRDEFSNERQLVQQIGRVIRHPEPLRRSAAPALILSENIDGVEELWRRYTDFDDACLKNDRRPPLRNDKEAVQEILRAFPLNDYVARKFRKRINFEDPDLSKDIRLPLTAKVFEIPSPGFTANKAKAMIEQALDKDDRTPVRFFDISGHSAGCYLSIKVEHSPHFDSAFFPYTSLCITAYCIGSRYLFLYDSHGLWLEDKAGTLRKCSPSKLERLFGKRENAILKNVSLKNSDIARGSIRSRSISAKSLDEAAPFLGDSMYLITRALGGPEAHPHWYVGFSRARLRQETSDYVSLENFAKWAEQAAQNIERDVAHIPFLDRFARPMNAPADPDPVSILLDIEHLGQQFTKDDGTMFECEDVCLEINPLDGLPNDGCTHEFTVHVGKNPHKVFIGFDRKREIYRLRSDDLRQFYKKDAQPALDALPQRRRRPRASLLKRLEQKQAFRIIPSTKECIYAYGHFYSTALDFVQGGAATLLKGLLNPIPCLTTADNETGEKSDGKGRRWERGCMFDQIDRSLRSGSRPGPIPFPRRFPNVVCDDRGNEVADFIAFDHDCVVFVHADHVRKSEGRSTKASASVLHKICGQAVKNLDPFRLRGATTHFDAEKWAKPWRFGYEVRPRIRRGPRSSTMFRAQLLETVQRPNTIREVWLVLGRINSYAEILAEMKRHSPGPEMVQMYYLIASIHAQCKSIGADLRIFLPP